MEKRLQINIPSVQTYLNHAFPLAILENESAFHGWFFTNFTQLYTFSNRKNPISDFKIDFYSHNGKYPKVPFLEYFNFNKDTITIFNHDILNLIIEHINLNYYIEAGIDEYYWSSKRSFRKKHFHHDNLVYGYNLKEEKLYYLGYNKEMIFGEHSVHFNEFISSFTNDMEANIKLIKNFTQELLSETTKYVYHDNLNFDMDIFKQYLVDFLESKNSFNSHRGMESSVFGLEIYDETVRRITDDIRISKDMRIFRIIWEHKKIMHKRIKYLNNIGFLSNKGINYFSNRYLQLIDECTILRSNAMKYYITDKKEVLYSMCSRLEKIKLTEKGMLRELLSIIS